MTRPLVSVIIPAYNAAPTLTRAIDSVMAQTFGDWELIVVDDGSTDATADLVRACPGRVRLTQTTHVGPAGARNHAAASARGEWLAWLDADDVWYPHKLARQMALARSDNEIDLVSGNYHYLDQDLRQIGTGFERNPWLVGRIARAGHPHGLVFAPDDVPAFIRNGFGATITLMLRRTLFERLGGFLESLRVAEDVHLVMRAVTASRKFAAVCAPVAAYCLHQASAVRRDAEFSQRETIRAYHDLRHSLRQSGRSLRRAVALPLSRAYLDHATTLARLGRRWDGLRAASRSWMLKPDRASLAAMISMAVGG
jgi:GT2 family glycosyltransferase